MRQVKTKSGEIINALEDHDLIQMKAIFKEAGDIWYRAWVEQGRKHHGFCAFGKKIWAFHVAKYRRTCSKITLVEFDFTQGHNAAAEVVEPALHFLKKHGIEAFYSYEFID